MPVITVALDRNSSSLANGVLQRSDALLLRRGRAGHMENLFFHDCPVQIVYPVTERHLRQRQTQAYPISSQMVDVIEINPANGQIAKLLNGGGAFDMSKPRGLRLPGQPNQHPPPPGFHLE